MTGRLSIRTALGGVFVAFALSGCSGESTPAYYVAADNSLDSTPELRSEAVRVVGLVAKEAAKRRGRIAVSTFQGFSLSRLSWPIRHRFQPSEGLPNSDYYRDLDLARQVREVVGQANSLFEHQLQEQGTDNVGVLLAISELIRAEGASVVIVVIVSNMLAVSRPDGLAFTTQRLDDLFIRQALARLKREGKVADLRRVACVFIVGAGLVPDRPLTTENQLGLRRFWTRYFKVTGAKSVVWEPKLTVAPRCAPEED